MVRRPSALQILLIAIFSILTIASGFLYVSRSMLPYSEAGRYFDEANAVVYHDQALIPYLLIFLFMFGLLILTTVRVIKTVRK
jgi:hypothetical protein